MAEPRFGNFPRRWPLLAVFVIAAVVAACGGDDAGRPTPEPSPTARRAGTPAPTTVVTLTPTPLPSPAPTGVPPTMPPTPAPSPTQFQSLAPEINCPDGIIYDHSHLNIERLAAQPGMEDAVITEIDDSTIRIRTDEYVVEVQGVGKVVGVGGPDDLTNDQLTLISRAIDAVRYSC